MQFIEIMVCFKLIYSQYGLWDIIILEFLDTKATLEMSQEKALGLTESNI